MTKRIEEIESRLDNATPQGEFCLCGGDTPDHHTVDCYLGKTVGWHWTEDGRLLNQEGDLILGVHKLGCVYVNRGDAELFQNAPTDLRYLLDFAKAAREALEFYGDGHNYLAPLHQNATYFDAGLKARQALALLEAP